MGIAVVLFGIASFKIKLHFIHIKMYFALINWTIDTH